MNSTEIKQSIAKIIFELLILLETRVNLGRLTEGTEDEEHI